MKKIILMMATAMCLLAACTQTTSQPQTVEQVVDELIMSRRSIRQYTDSAIDEATLNTILQLGINAPNGRNQQAYELRVVNSKEHLDAMTAAVVNDHPEMAERLVGRNIFVGATTVIFIAADKSYDLSHVDCGLLGENIILAAWARGIGSCCLGAPVRMLEDSPSARMYLNDLQLSEGYELLYCIGLGYPAETPDAKPRREDKIKFIR